MAYERSWVHDIFDQSEQHRQEKIREGVLSKSFDQAIWSTPQAKARPDIDRYGNELPPVGQLPRELTPSEAAALVANPGAGRESDSFLAQARAQKPISTDVAVPGQNRSLTLSNNVPKRILSEGELDNAVGQLASLVKTIMQSQSLASRFPSEPPKGSVLRFSRTFREGQTPYQYVAYRATTGRWYMTGSDGNSNPAWTDLQTLIGNEPCEMSTEWREVPVVNSTDYDKIDDPKAWFERTFMGEAQVTGEDDAKASKKSSAASKGRGNGTINAVVLDQD